MEEEQLAFVSDTGMWTRQHLTYLASAARVLDTLTQNVLLAPIEAPVIPLPHQLRALSRAVSGDRIRYLLADEVGLGKTIEAGLILRELYEELLQVHGESVRREQERAEAGFAARRRMIERLGLQSVRSARLQELQDEERNWRQDIERRERVVPEMTPILVAKVRGVEA